MPHNPGMTQDAPRPGSGSPPEPDDRVPVFGTWPRIYAAVLICLALVMAGIALFQNGSY